MEFYPYATGRALHSGYGFDHGAADLPPALTAACQGRGLSKLRGGSVIYELRPLDSQHTALQMTQVTQFGGKGANFCYTYSLISKEFAEPEALLQLLQRENFPNDESFLALEAQKQRGEQIPLEHLDVSREGGCHSISLPVQCSKAVMCALVNYIWEQCENNSNREKVTPATIVLPSDFSHQDMLDFVGKVFLPVLPDSMRRQFSVVFGCTRDFAGTFPSNTVCFVIQKQETPNKETVYKHVFEPFSAAALPEEAIVITPGKLLLSEALGESTEDNKLYHSMISALPVSCRESFVTANTLLRLCLSLEKTGITVKKLQEDWDLYSKLYHELTHRLPEGAIIYDMLLPLETVMLEQVQKHLSQFTIPELSEILMISGWGQTARKKLLDTMLAHISTAEDALVELRNCIKDCNCQYAFVMDQLHEQLQHLLVDNIKQEPTEKRFSRLCELLATKPNARGFSAWIQCASKITLTKQLAVKVVQMTPSLLAMKDNSLLEQLMQLFELQPHTHEMWQIMELLNFTYDRVRWQQWDKAERSIISAKFVGDMDQIYESISAEEISGNIQKLQQLNTYWQAQCKRFNRDWHAFATEIAASRAAVQNAVLRTLSACTDTTRYRELANVLGNDWYGDTARITAGEALVKRLENIFELPEQTKANQAQIDDRLEKLKLLPDLLKHFGQQELYQNDTRVQLLVTAMYMADKKCDAETMMGTANKMHQAYQENQTVSVSLFVKKCVEGMPEPNLYKAQLKDQPLQPEESGILMVWNLIKHLDKPSSGWASFFNLMGWKPGKNDSPWDDDSIWLLNMLKYVALQLKQLNAAPVWYDELQEFLLHAEGWDNYIQHMQNDKAYARFMQLPNAKAPQLADILHTPAPIVGRHQRRN